MVNPSHVPVQLPKALQLAAPRFTPLPGTLLVNLRLKIVHTWQQCGSLRETARQLSISRNTVRKWVRRYLAQGEAGLRDRSRRPQRTPNRTPPQLEDQVLSLHRERGWGRRRISHALGLPEGTVRHILRRHLGEGHRRRKKRKTFYPAHWAWEEEKPFRLAQVDTKDILDKGTLGTKLWDHLGSVPRSDVMKARALGRG